MPDPDGADVVEHMRGEPFETPGSSSDLVRVSTHCPALSFVPRKLRLYLGVFS